MLYKPPTVDAKRRTEALYLYHALDLTSVEVGDLLGVSKASVNNWLKSLGQAWELAPISAARHEVLTVVAADVKAQRTKAPPPKTEKHTLPFVVESAEEEPMLSPALPLPIADGGEGTNGNEQRFSLGDLGELYSDTRRVGEELERRAVKIAQLEAALDAMAKDSARELADAEDTNDRLVRDRDAQRARADAMEVVLADLLREKHG